MIANIQRAWHATICRLVAFRAPAGPRLVKFCTPDDRPYFLSVDPSQDVYHAAVAKGGGFGPPGHVAWCLINAGDIVFDLGANIGTIAVPLAVKGAHVHAFEMLPENVAFLSRAAAANEASIDIHCVAIWSDDATLSVGDNPGAWAQIVSSSGRTVPAISIDNFMRRYGIGRVAAIKIDIEGSELAALLGMAECVERYHPDIVIEANILCTQGQYSIHDLMAALTEHGYRLYRIGDKALHPFSANGFQETITCDYLATVRTEADLTKRVGYAIRSMAFDEIVASIVEHTRGKAQDVHRIYAYLAITQLAPDELRLALCGDRRIAALVARWQPLVAAASDVASRLLKGAAAHAAPKIENLRACLPHRSAAADNPRMRPPAIIASILAAIVAVVILTRFLWAFSDWNKEQACATAGGRNCGHYADQDR